MSLVNWNFYDNTEWNDRNSCRFNHWNTMKWHKISNVFMYCFLSFLSLHSALFHKCHKCLDRTAVDTTVVLDSSRSLFTIPNNYKALWENLALIVLHVWWVLRVVWDENAWYNLKKFAYGLWRQVINGTSSHLRLPVFQMAFSPPVFERK